MHHTLLTIANARFLPVDKFTTFAKERGSEYLCDDETVGTWDVDALVDSYRNSIGIQEYESDRTEIIKNRNRQG